MNSVDQPLTLQISFRVAKTIRDELERRALSQKLNLSDYVRKLVVDALATSDGDCPGEIPQLTDFRQELSEHKQELTSHKDGIRLLLTQHFELLTAKDRRTDVRAMAEVLRLREDLATIVTMLLVMVGDYEPAEASAWAKENLSPTN